VRMLVCDHYLALYRVDTDTISVARIINARQDYMRILLHGIELPQKEERR